MSDPAWTDIASLASSLSSLIIGAAVAYVAWRQWRTENERLIHERFDRRFAVYKATDDFIRKAFTIGVDDNDIFEFYSVTKEAYFLFDAALASYLEDEVLAKGNAIFSMGDLSAVEDQAKLVSLVEERRELTEWMRTQRNPARERFAKFLRSD
jgi:hypothetical protein